MDEFELFQARGLIGASAAERILSEANAVIARIECDDPSFNGAWPDWRPDPSWTIPELPVGWQDSEAIGDSVE